MNNIELYLCCINRFGHSTKDEALIKDYWLFEEFEKVELHNEGERKTHRFEIEYKYSIEELRKAYDYNAVRTIQYEALITSTSKLFNCLSCNKKIFAKNRTELKRILQKLPEICDDCKIKEINETALKKIELLESSDIYTSLPSFDVKGLESLSYLEKVVLLVLMFEKDLEIEQPTNISLVHLNLSGVNDLDLDLLSKLMDKKAIYKVDYEYIPILTESIGYFEEQRQFFYDDVMKKVDEYKKNILKEGLYFLIPEEFNNYNELTEYLFEKISDQEVTHSDLNAITDFVTSILVFQAYQLIENIKKEQRIPIDLNLSLDTLLTKTVQKYPMVVVFNIFRYKAKGVAAKVYSERNIPLFIENKLFVKFVEDYLNYLALLRSDE